MNARELTKKCKQLGTLLGINYLDANSSIQRDIGDRWALIEHTIHELAHAACLKLDLAEIAARQAKFTAESAQSAFPVKHTVLTTRIAVQLAGYESAPEQELQALAIEHAVLGALGFSRRISIFAIAAIAKEQDVVPDDVSGAEILRKVMARRRSRELAAQVLGWLSEPGLERACSEAARSALSAADRKRPSAGRPGARRSR